MDSNQRRLSQRIYSPSPLATRAPLQSRKTKLGQNVDLARSREQRFVWHFISPHHSRRNPCLRQFPRSRVCMCHAAGAAAKNVHQLNRYRRPTSRNERRYRVRHATRSRRRAYRRHSERKLYNFDMDSFAGPAEAQAWVCRFSSRMRLSACIFLQAAQRSSAPPLGCGWHFRFAPRFRRGPQRRRREHKRGHYAVSRRAARFSAK